MATTPGRQRIWVGVSALSVFVAGGFVAVYWMGLAALGTDSCPSPSDPGPRMPLCTEAVFEQITVVPVVGVVAALVVLGGGFLVTLRGWRAWWWIGVAWAVWVASVVTAVVMSEHAMG